MSFQTWFWKVIVLKIFRKYKAKQFLFQSFRLQDSNLSVFIFLIFLKAVFGNFQGMREIMPWIWCHNINPAYKKNVMLLLIFFKTLRHCPGYVTIRPCIVNIWRSLQSWRTVGATAICSEQSGRSTFVYS